MAVQLRTTEASETWRSLLIAFSEVHRRLADELQDETGLRFEWYEILLTLAQAPDGALRPSELADNRHLSRSGATRLIDRMERDELVERRACDTDGRGSLVALTPKGEQAFRRAGRIHLRGIEAHVGAQLSTEEMADVRRVLTKLAQAQMPDQ